jgi:ribonuclease HI
MKKNSLKKLLELLAGGLPLDNAWEQAGFLAKAEAEDALREMAAELGKELSAGCPEPAPAAEPVSAGTAAKTVDITGMTISELIVHADGASRGNPGPSSAAVVAYDTEGTELTSRAKRLGKATNNVAEYNACILALELAADFGVPSVTIRMDSELVVKQMNGEYKIRNKNLAVLAGRVRELAAGFDKCLWEHVPRARNEAADKLANEILDEAVKTK